MFRSSNVSRVFSKTRVIFCHCHARGLKTQGGVPKNRKTLSDSRAFWLHVFKFGDILVSKYVSTSKPNPNDFFWTTLGGHLGSEPQFGNCRLTNCLAHVFQNPDRNVNFSYTSPQNQRYANETPGNRICFQCFYIFY